jgi:uncharacterized protein
MKVDYQTLIDEAMLGIVQKILANMQDEGLKDEQCFYISFRTDYPEVILSKNVRARYPKEITVVLQYQYKDLRVLEDRFSVNIAFNGIPETIEVPFSALTGFADPSVNFSLQFRQPSDELYDELLIDEVTELLEMKPKLKEKREVQVLAEEKKAGEVISLDKFRKRSK